MDDTNQISGHNLPRGWGGVVTLWRSEINNLIKQIEISNPRIVAIQINKLLLINVYMPSGNSKSKKSEYMDTLEEIDIIIQRHSTLDVIIAGDFNMDLCKDSYLKDERRCRLVRLMNEYSLTNTTPGHITMMSHSGAHFSAIDMVLTSRSEDCKSKVLEKVTWNTSCHTPISFTIAVHDLVKSKPVKPFRHTPQLQPIWNTLDISAYNSCIQEHAADLELELIHPHKAADIVTQIINLSTLEATDSRMSRGPKLRKITFNKSIIDALKKSRLTHHLWKEAGRPDSSHPLSLARRKSSRSVRSAVRCFNVQKRESRYNEIMTSNLGDQKLFHKLIKEAQMTNNTTTTFVVNGHPISNSDAVREAWSSHFNSLATPESKPEWNETVLRDAERDVATILDSCKKSPQITHFTVEDVSEAILDLNKGKSPDLVGLRAEHFSAAKTTLPTILTPILNNMMLYGASTEMKTARKIAIPKKGKDPSLMSNYRGINIGSTLGKIFEKLILSKPVHQPFSSLQFGFTEGTSPLMAALCLTEVLADAKSNGHNLLVATLDTQKAFDVVSHPIMLRELWRKGISPDVWKAVYDLYKNNTEMVLWDGELGQPYEVRQGVGQGRILSPMLYKVFMDSVLESLAFTGNGYRIGGVYLGSPTVADDVMLLEKTNIGFQRLLDSAHSSSNDNRYSIHPTKSEIASRNKLPVKASLGPAVIPYVDSVTHLGMTRNLENNNDNIKNRAKQSLNTLYALIPAGLHGENGISPSASRKVMVSYVLPRLIYGLEVLVLTKTHVADLERTYCSMLRKLLSLREGTASSAVYLIMGLPPLEAEIHIRLLTTFGSITRMPLCSPMRCLAMRQLSTDNVTTGWFRYVTSVARKYDIENILLSSLLAPWGKDDWKSFCKETVLSAWLQKLKENANTKSSMSLLDLQHVSFRAPHHLWPIRGAASKTRVAASYRAKFISGSYILQSNRARFNQFKVDPSCPLCGNDREDMTHLLLVCPRLQHSRKRHLNKIKSLLLKLQIDIPTDNDNLAYTILNCGTSKHCTAHNVYLRPPKNIISPVKNSYDNIGKCSYNGHKLCMCTKLNYAVNDLCIDLHNVRSAALNCGSEGS